MHRLIQQLNPDHLQDLVWDYDAIDPIIPTEVHAVTDLFNATEFSQLITPLRALVTNDLETGIDYAVLGDWKDSDEAIVHFNPFGNGMTDNMLLRAEYLQSAFAGFGIKGAFLTLAAPTANPAIKLKRRQRRMTARGEFEALARHYLQLIEELGYTRLRIIGFSQGATLAASVAAHAPDYGMTVTHVALGEPANIMQRTRVQLGKDFNASAAHLNPAIDASGIEHLKNFYGGGSSVRYVLGLARQGRLNASLLKGLSKATFRHDLERILQNESLITLGWGGLNTISPATTMHRLVDQSRTDSESALYAIHSVELTGAHHTWADRLNVLATFYAYALLRPAD